MIESCLSEIGSRGGSVPQSGNDEILLTFVLWEQSLRRNLTGATTVMQTAILCYMIVIVIQHLCAITSNTDY